MGGPLWVPSARKEPCQLSCLSKIVWPLDGLRAPRGLVRSQCLLVIVRSRVAFPRPAMRLRYSASAKRIRVMRAGGLGTLAGDICHVRARPTGAGAS